MCKSRFSEYILARIERDKERLKESDIEVEKVYCLWYCEDGPNVVIDGTLFNKATPSMISKQLFSKKE